MQRISLLVALATALLLAGCASPAGTAAQRCAGVFPAGSPAYADCLRAEHGRELRQQQRQLDEKWQLDRRIRAG